MAQQNERDAMQGSAAAFTTMLRARYARRAVVAAAAADAVDAVMTFCNVYLQMHHFPASLCAADVLPGVHSSKPYLELFLHQAVQLLQQTIRGAMHAAFSIRNG